MEQKHFEPWFLETEDEEVAPSLWGTVDQLLQDQSYQYEAYLHYLRLYSNRAVASLTGRGFNSALDDGEKIRLNVVQACIDTSVAQIAGDKSRPLHGSSGADSQERKKVRRLDQYVLGAFHAIGHYNTAMDVFRDAGIFGTGFEKFTTRGSQVVSERVPATEILFDDKDARLGDPRCMYHIKKNADKRTLIADFAEDDEDKRVAIEESGLMDAWSGEEKDSYEATAIEAWYLESKPGAGDGRHVVAVQNGVLLDEKWSDPFPFAVWRWSTLPFGYLGIGLAELLAPIQVEVNYIAQKIQKLMTLATSMVWLQEGSGVSPITNEDWGMRKYRGRPPIFQTTASVSSEYFHHLDRLYDRAFEISGISQLSASSSKPAGLESGEALKIYHDIGTMRFRHTGQRWGQFHVDAGERLIEASRRLLKDGSKPKTLTVGHEKVEEIDFDTVNLARDKYTVSVYPASLLPEEPAGKVDAINKLAQAQQDPESLDMLWGLLDGVPDVRHIVEMKTAPQRFANAMIDRMLETGRPETPVPLMNLPMTRKLATLAWMKAKEEEVEEDKLDALRMFIENVDGLMAAAMPPPPPTPMPAGSEPGPEVMPPSMPGPVDPQGEF